MSGKSWDLCRTKVTSIGVGHLRTRIPGHSDPQEPGRPPLGLLFRQSSLPRQSWNMTAEPMSSSPIRQNFAMASYYGRMTGMSVLIAGILSVGLGLVGSATRASAAKADGRPESETLRAILSDLSRQRGTQRGLPSRYPLAGLCRQRESPEVAKRRRAAQDWNDASERKTPSCRQ